MMRRPKTDRRTDRKDSPSWRALVLVAAIGLTAGLGSAELVRNAAVGPKVGDIVAFDKTRHAAVAPAAGRVTAERAGQAGCVLDPGTMRATGGSLIVEERRPGRNPSLRVHWSGLRTSTDDRNCGASADLVLHASDMAILAAGAGGYGPTPRGGVPASWLTASAAIP